jgi:hypothetical protein
LGAEDFNDNTPIVMSLVQGAMHYARLAVLERLTQLGQFRSLRFLVVLDQDERVLAYLPHRSAARLLNDPDRGEQFIDLVNGNNPNAFTNARLPGVVTRRSAPARATRTR